MGTFSVGAKDARKGGMILCSEPKSFHSSRLRIRWKKAGYEAENLHANVLSLPRTGVWKWGTGKKETRPRRERCVREEYPPFGFPRAQFLKTAVQQKGAVLRPGYSDTRPSWPEYGLLFYLNLSKSARACQIRSLQDLFEPYIARAFFSCFLTTEVQGATSKSLVFLLFQRIFWSFIRLFYTVPTKFLENKSFVVVFPVPETSMISFRTPACYNGPLQLGSFMSVLQCDIDKIINKLFRLCIPFSTA